MIHYDRREIIRVCKTSTSMSEASRLLGIHFNTFKRIAISCGCYKPNPGLKGYSRPKIEGHGKVPLSEILDGKHPSYQTYKLRVRLIAVGIKSNACEECKTSKWNGKHISCELHHINGNRQDHRLTNLKMLCPNCHSQTNTYRSKNRQLVP